MKTYAASNIGLGRSVNQDAYYLPRGDERFCVLADGMGGHQAGEVASALAIVAFTDVLRKAAHPSEGAMQKAVASANEAVFQEAQKDPTKRGMGTTLTALWFDEKMVFLSHVGDSRAYLMRNKALMQLSSDHSLVGEMVVRGELSLKEARQHPQRNMITRAIGTGAEVKADIIRLDYHPSDIWLLCSDGLSNYVRSVEMSEILTREISWQGKIDTMIELALSRGGSDNITVVVAVGEEAGR